jgi:predicted PurR-regulated permease PerM
MKNKKIDEFFLNERKRKIKLTLTALFFFSALGLIALLFVPVTSSKIEATVIDSTYLATETGNIIKLKVLTDGGRHGYVSIPSRTNIKFNKKVMLVEKQTAIGKTTYSFIRYIE